VASGSEGGSIIVHSTSSNKVEYRADNVFDRDREVSGLCYLPNGSLVACGDCIEGGDSSLIILGPSLELVQTLEEYSGYVWCVTVSPSGSHFASGDNDGTVMIWSEPGEGGEWASVQVLRNHRRGIKSVCFSPDGKQLATGSRDRDKSINLYSFNEEEEEVEEVVEQEQEQEKVNTSAEEEEEEEGKKAEEEEEEEDEEDEEGSAILAHTLEGHTWVVNSLSFSPDCKFLCSGSHDESIKFWNPADGSLVKSIDQAHTYGVLSVSYSPNGRVLVSAGGKTMKIWDAETFELKHTFEQEFVTNQLTITADSNFIVSANDDHTVRITPLPRITPCREYTRTALTPILNLILHIVYKWEFVSFSEQNEETSTLEEVMRRLGECVHNGGYNVTSVILSFLSPAHLPVQLTPTRWKSDPASLILFMRARHDRLQEEIAKKEAVIKQQRAENAELRQQIADYEQEDDEDEEEEEEEDSVGAE